MESSDKFTSSKEVIAFLASTFPDCFTLEGDAKPLKIGIFQDIVEHLSEDARLSKTLLRSSLRHYTNSWRYLHCVKADAHRVDLNGNHCELVGTDHANHAAEQLKESKEKVAARRKEQAKAQERSTNADKDKQKRKRAAVPSRGTKGADKRPKRPAPERLNETSLKTGTSVTVKLGKVPMDAVITEIAKDGVHVQLDSGMAIKVNADALRLAPSKR